MLCLDGYFLWQRQLYICKRPPLLNDCRNTKKFFKKGFLMEAFLDLVT